MKNSKTMSLVLAGIVTTSGFMTAIGGTAHAQENNEKGTHTKAGEVSAQHDKGDTSKPINFDKAQDMSPKERVRALTQQDKKLHDKEVKEDINDAGITQNLQGGYPNVNNYIKSHNIKHAKIKEDARIGNLPKYSYKSGKYIGVVIHETGNSNSSLQGEVNYMYGHFNNAFVHAYVDGNQIRQTAPADYLAWGAGPNANPYFYQIEHVEAHNFNQFAKAVNNQAYLTAYMLKRNHLTPKLADTHNGSGTVISHNAVSRYYGGTDHTDPFAYFRSWGYDMNQFYNLVQTHYKALNHSKQGQDKKSSKITGSTYTVKHGDTLYSISQRSGASIENIKKWSNIKSQVLHTGQKLRVKAPSSSKKDDKITSKVYQVKKGDTLYNISKRSGISVENIKKYNQMKSNNLTINQKLYLALTYTVKKGDTLYKIANKYHMSVKQLKTNNGLTKDKIQIGQKLIVK